MKKTRCWWLQVFSGDYPVKKGGGTLMTSSVSDGLCCRTCEAPSLSSPAPLCFYGQGVLLIPEVCLQQAQTAQGIEKEILTSVSLPCLTPLSYLLNVGKVYKEEWFKTSNMLCIEINQLNI